MEPEPESGEAVVLVAVLTMVYDPIATVGDVIRRVVETAAPGPMVTLEAPKIFCQLVVGVVAWSAKLEAEHPALSLLVTAMLYVTIVPA
jgi:hypothetical protein